MSLFPLSALADWVFPRRCPVCGQALAVKRELICSECFKRLSLVREPTCMRCGKEISSGLKEFCEDCSRHRRSFLSGKALVNYNEAAAKSMAGIKYGNKREYLDFYAEAICARYGKWALRLRPDALVPVPIHPSKKRQRGYNQAGILANKIGRNLGVPVEEGALLRARRTIPQKGLTPEERLKNLEQAFRAAGDLSRLRTVILVDDIYTTGSTMEACTRVLHSAGAGAVYFLAVCIGHAG